MRVLVFGPTIIVDGVEVYKNFGEKINLRSIFGSIKTIGDETFDIGSIWTMYEITERFKKNKNKKISVHFLKLELPRSFP